MRFVLAVLLVASCGSVTSSLTTDGGDAAAAGAGGASSASGRGGSEASAGRGGGGADTAGAAGASNAGAGGAAAVDAGVCIGGDGDVIGFAYNPGCDGGSTLPTSCHANCTLNDQHFVGCSNDSRVDAGRVICHATCAECP